MVITERDHELLEVLDQVGGLDVPSMQLMFDMHETAVRRRMVRLEQYGMVESFRPFLRSPALYAPTRRGLRVMLGREDVAAPSISAGSYVHKLHLAHVLAELDAHQVRWQGERETRRNQRAAEAEGDRAETTRFSLHLSWLDRRHVPDALIWPSQTAESTEQPVAIEVELAQKSRRKLDEILDAYTSALDMAGVVYVCGPHSIDAVTKAVGRLQDRAHMIAVVPLYEFGPHFGAPNVGGRPRRKRAVETAPIKEPARGGWIVEHLTGDPISVLEQQLRDTSTPPLPL